MTEACPAEMRPQEHARRRESSPPPTLPFLAKMKEGGTVLVMTPLEGGSAVKLGPLPANMNPEGGSGVTLSTHPAKLKGGRTFKKPTRPEGGIVKKTTRPEGGSVVKPGKIFATTPPKVDQA